MGYSSCSRQKENLQKLSTGVLLEQLLNGEANEDDMLVLTIVDANDISIPQANIRTCKGTLIDMANVERDIIVEFDGGSDDNHIHAELCTGLTLKAFQPTDVYRPPYSSSSSSAVQPLASVTCMLQLEAGVGNQQEPVWVIVNVHTSGSKLTDPNLVLGEATMRGLRILKWQDKTQHTIKSIWSIPGSVLRLYESFRGTTKEGLPYIGKIAIESHSASEQKKQPKQIRQFKASRSASGKND